MHDLTIIWTVAGGLTAALIFGWITLRLGLSPILGYLIGGILVGPYTPGFVADAAIASQLAEIGVILLMFGVGLQFHPKDLLRVRRIAIPGAIVQSLVATLFGWIAARTFGWSSGAGLILGFSLAVASTVVLIRVLIDHKRLESDEGQIAVGWLIVEDIFTVVVLVLVPVVVTTSTTSNVTWAVLDALAKVVGFAGLMWIVGRRLIPPLLERMARSGSTELFTLAVFVFALGIAAAAAMLFDVSVALGAFFAGLVVGQSRVGHQAAAEMLPFRDVFSALFFVSIGMLFNPMFVIEQPKLVIIVLAIILIAKPLAAFLIVFLFRYPIRVAFTIAVALGQIGEFSFILGSLGKSLGVLPQVGFDALVAGALISIALNPLLFKLIPKLERQLGLGGENDPSLAIFNKSDIGGIDVVPQLIIVGHGEIGEHLARYLLAKKIRFVVIDNNIERLDVLQKCEVLTIFGDAGNYEVLKAGKTDHVSLLIITIPNTADKLRITLAAKQLNPQIYVIACANSQGEAAWLKEFGLNQICDTRQEIAGILWNIILKKLA